MVEPVADPAQLLNDSEDIKTTFESDADEMREVNEFEQERDSQEDDSIIRRSSSTSIKPNWL